jgi:hypothetical protein
LPLATLPLPHRALLPFRRLTLPPRVTSRWSLALEPLLRVVMLYSLPARVLLLEAM